MAREIYQTANYSLDNSHSQVIKSGRSYTILFISHGSCYADIDGNPVFCGTEDLLLLKPCTSTTLHNEKSKLLLKYILISVTPEYLDELSDLDINFQQALNFIPNDLSLSHIKSESAMLIKNLAIQIMSLSQVPPEFGNELFIKNMYSMLILLTVRSCIDADVVVKQHRSKKLIIDDIFSYISAHLAEEISLDVLEKEFFVSKYYICREFKRMTGLTPHSYIVKSRLNLCCKLIEQGFPITEVYQQGGFGSYNHFFSAFKKEYRMTPKEYYANIRQSGGHDYSLYNKNGTI